jgi:hypothetical protein
VFRETIQLVYLLVWFGLCLQSWAREATGQGRPHTGQS